MNGSQSSSNPYATQAVSQNAPRSHGLAFNLSAGRGIPSYFAARRHKKILRDNLQSAINKPTIRRLARRGGIRRIKADIYPTVQEVVKDRLKIILQHTFALVELANRKTVTTLDVIYALRVVGSPIYGFGMIEKGAEIKDHAATYREKKRRHAEERERVQKLNTTSRSTTRVGRESTSRYEQHSSTRELKNGRVDDFMRQMKLGARSK